VSSLDLSGNPGNFWKVFKLFKKSAVFNHLKPPSVSKETLINNYDSFAPPGAPMKFPECRISQYPPFFDTEFNLNELKELILSSRTNSAPGLDLIIHSLLKILSDKAIEILLSTFKKILQDESYPDLWKQFAVILIQKPDGVNFRPTALSSCVLKLLEKMIKNRLERYVECNRVLPDFQFGFRRGKSCEDCLSLLFLDIYRGFARRDFVRAIFLDIKAAYDNVDPGILFDAINSFNIPRYYKKFIMNLISPRFASFFEGKNFYGQRTLYRGLLQGSAISPILFNIYTSGVSSCIPAQCRAIQFADDIVVVCSDSDIGKTVRYLGIAFDKISTWLLSLGLEVSTTKTKFMIFHRSRNRKLPRSIAVSSGVLPVCYQVKYLGMIIDPGLRWQDHIQFLCSRSAKYMNILKWMMGRSWGISPS